ncbi:hypothetical protein SAICODRAFT_65528 [Saitoella complicata NRRL Y-17804]|uniref:FAD-binding FR-type domain-containing protein n=1 Tax=Saitoella complicata (strain BCRC 22490 / CBS 7301 / JCM 7358 / NBRC 10748 / NRRL Y-17804) TaxID=698492 RepID=A0A0E9NNR4_SAICN|nr:uncharacterized protein SAICODRAFT_65528 [Saitoella complicata NRRL Y-17804]ODQ53518.1 hypothetical protein SAICODRAFT_65528 [Saitoella complicata NRRL Y-17804]GAO51065.1 hypothetical protein G7K_5177-t1 [Saitoella complicata NRRL Y-17804]
MKFTIRSILFYFFWYGSHIGLFAYGWWAQATNTRLAGLNTLKFSVWSSRGAGLCLAYDGALILLPVCRTLVRWVRPKAKWLPLDENLWFHRQVAYQIVVWAIVHTTAHYVNFYNVEKTQIRPVKAWQIHYTEAGGITGHVMLLCMVLMYTTAHHSIRKQCFEAFWYTHHLAFIFLLALYTHATGCFVRDTAQPFSPFAGKNFWNHCLGYEGWRFTLWGFGFYLLERLARVVRSRKPTNISKVVMHPQGVIELQFVKPSFNYTSGQWLFLNVPAVSKHQWHPFTITSAPADPYVSVHVRQVGDWTRSLGSLLGIDEKTLGISDGVEMALQNGRALPKIMVDGPFGAPAEDVETKEIAVLVGAGIGVTPWASVLKNIWHNRRLYMQGRRSKASPLRRIEFVWICRDIASFEWFQVLLSALERDLGEIEDLQLNIHIYLTQRLDTDTAANIMINSAGAQTDPLTRLRARTRFGRPNWSSIFLGMREGIERGTYLPGREGSLKTEVGVYFCGPGPLGKTLKEEAKKASSEEVVFPFWKEHF